MSKDIFQTRHPKLFKFSICFKEINSTPCWSVKIQVACKSNTKQVGKCPFHVRCCAVARWPHARENTLTQVKPDSGWSPSLTFWYRANRLESISSRRPSGREAERYRTTGNGCGSETVQERTQKPVTAARRMGTPHRYPQAPTSTNTHLTGTCCLPGQPGAQSCVSECVCVLIKQSSHSFWISQCSVTCPPLFFPSRVWKERSHSFIFNRLLSSLVHPQ